MSERERPPLLRREFSLDVAFLRRESLPGFPNYHCITAPVFHGSYEQLEREISERGLRGGQIQLSIVTQNEGDFSLLISSRMSAEGVISNRKGEGNGYDYVALCEPIEEGHRYTIVGLPLETHSQLRGYYPFVPRSTNR